MTTNLPPGTNYCQCPTCGEVFTNVTNFDIHRKTLRPKAGKRVCVNPGTITDKHGKARLRRNAKGIWTRADGAYVPR